MGWGGVGVLRPAEGGAIVAADGGCNIGLKIGQGLVLWSLLELLRSGGEGEVYKGDGEMKGERVVTTPCEPSSYMDGE